MMDRTKDEDQLQALAQVVAWHRSLYGHTKKDVTWVCSGRQILNSVR